MFYIKEKTSYLEALKTQYELSDYVRKVKKDIFFITSHHPCFTLAQNKASLFKEHEVPVYLVKRGGFWTFHHLDQWICYLHFSISEKKTLKNIYLFLLEVLKETLESFFLKKFEIHDGIWFQKKKILSLGLGLDKMVTLHGVALNFSLNPHLIKNLEPCSLKAENYAGLEDFFSFERDKLKNLLHKNLLNSYEERFKR